MHGTNNLLRGAAYSNSVCERGMEQGSECVERVSRCWLLAGEPSPSARSSLQCVNEPLAPHSHPVHLSRLAIVHLYDSPMKQCILHASLFCNVHTVRLHVALD